MEKMNKPAWFELADNDQPANVSPKARKGGIFAVVTTLTLTGVAGWGFISSEEFPAAVASASSAVIEKVSGNSTSASNSANPITAPTGYEDDEDDDHKGDRKESKKDHDDDDEDDDDEDEDDD